MKIGKAGLDIIKSIEKCRLKAYDDGTGVWTIGWGHTGGVKPGDTCTQAQADQWLKDDVAKTERAINANGLDMYLNQNRFDALCSLLYNCGTGILPNFIPLIKAKNWDAVTAKMAKYVYAKGVKLNGLITRRAKEIALFKKKIQ